MKFTKYTGLGNDFVILDGAIALSVLDPFAMAKTMCDRHFGIGADGLVFLLPSEKADIKMRIINSDGSEAEMCGNASRCVALHLFREGILKKKEISLDTLAGIIKTTIIDEVKGLVQVDMGSPRLLRKEIPMQGSGQEQALSVGLEIENHSFVGTGVSMGNPHFVIKVDDISKLDLAKVGPQIETHPLFPSKTNVEFVQILDNQNVRMRVWERGAGITQACGTGSCATAVACVLNGWTDTKITVKLDGGELEIYWPKSGSVFMTGLATKVFSGDYYL